MYDEGIRLKSKKAIVIIEKEPNVFIFFRNEHGSAVPHSVIIYLHQTSRHVYRISDKALRYKGFALLFEIFAAHLHFIASDTKKCKNTENDCN